MAADFFAVSASICVHPRHLRFSSIPVLELARIDVEKSFDRTQNRPVTSLIRVATSPYRTDRSLRLGVIRRFSAESLQNPIRTSQRRTSTRHDSTQVSIAVALAQHSPVFSRSDRHRLGFAPR
jgi:hypothetical protein